MHASRLQALLITYLSKHGSIKLLLPDGITLELGINQLDDKGELKKVENYCWVIVNREDKMAVLDSYNLGIRFMDNKQNLMLEDEFIAPNGEKIRRVDIV